MDRAPHGHAVVTTHGITVRFGDLVANEDLSLTARVGEVTGLIGPNGAGKTTFFNVLSGALSASAGTIRLFGEEIAKPTPRRMARLGVMRTFQNLKVVPRLTVLENVMIGAARGRWPSLPAAFVGHPAARRRTAAIRNAARQALEFVDVGAAPDDLVGDLPYGAKRRVEIARALAAQPKLLLLDEPTAGMGPSETAEAGELILSIVTDLGVPVIVVEHDMVLIRQVADSVYVLDQGSLIAHGPPADVLTDRHVIDVYLGGAKANA